MHIGYTERKDIKISIAITVGAFIVLLAAWFPAGLGAIPALQGLNQLSLILLGLLIIVAGGGVMVVVWDHIHIIGQAILIFAFIAFGYFIVVPAFLALGLVGLIFTMLGFRKMGRRGRKA